MMMTTKIKIIAMALTDNMYCAFMAILLRARNDSSHPIPPAKNTWSTKNIAMRRDKSSD
jgi:hypothetical protein